MPDGGPSLRRFTAALLAMLAVGVGMAGYLLWKLNEVRAPSFHGTAYDPPGPAADFALTDHDGRPVTLASYRGAPVLLFFGFTNCPDVCPMTLTRLGAAVRALGDDAADVRVLLVTVDPARDTPAALKAYAARFGPFVTGLTGDSATLAKVRADYGAYATVAPVEAVPGAAHEGHGDPHAGHGAAAPAAAATRPVHSGYVYGIDRGGDLRVLFPEAAREEAMRDDLRALLRL